MRFPVTASNLFCVNIDLNQFIDAHGGSAKFAKATGFSPGYVRQWKFRKRIPRNAWPEIIEALPTVTLEMLLDLERRAA